MNKFMYLGLAILMILSVAVPISAQNVDEPHGLITPQFTYVSFVNSNLTITPMGEAICKGAATLYSPSQTVELTVELQLLTGSNWTPIRSWTASGPGLPGIEIERSYYVVRGTYRVCTTAKVRDAAGNLLENVSVYSPVVTY